MYLRLAESRISNKECRITKSEGLGSQHRHFVIRHSSFVISRRALTLVEMLIGMAITLVMMAAVVTLFANIGSGIRVQQAAMEMSSQLRTARARLFQDLAGATCAPRPKLPSDDHDDGYLEIVEGQWSDKNPSILLDGTDSGPTSANPELDYKISQVPSGGDPTIVLPATGVAGAVTNGRGLGDYDDILALTVRSENEPFRGRWRDKSGFVRTIESNLAEIVWYAVENPADNSLGEPGMRTVYRRVLLIAPWLQGKLQLTTGGNPAADFYRNNDISVRRVATGTGSIWVPNSLSDLVKRENRFAHHKNGFSIYPHAIQTAKIRIFPSTDLSPLHPFGEFFEGLVTPNREGEDLMLNDVLAFDVRVFDPGAPLFNNAGRTVEPSDRGWNSSVGNPLGLGAYCDLGWNWDWINKRVIRNWTHPLGAAAPVFNLLPNTKSGLGISSISPPISPPINPAVLTGYPAVYDTGSYLYENDGIDQDLATDNGAGTDQGTNGLDDIVPYDLDNNPSTPSVIPKDSNDDPIAINGVDDVGERETASPYDVPLRGIQVKLRVYEPGTRQIRAATVTKSFVPQ